MAFYRYMTYFLPMPKVVFVWFLRISFFRMCLRKVSHITHSRGKVFPLLCFVYYIMSVNFKAVSQASVYVDFHVTLKPRRPTFNHRHKIKHQLQHPRRPGLSAQLSSLLAHGVGEKGLMIAWWSLSCKCAH